MWIWEALSHNAHTSKTHTAQCCTRASDEYYGCGDAMRWRKRCGRADGVREGVARAHRKQNGARTWRKWRHGERSASASASAHARTRTRSGAQSISMLAVAHAEVGSAEIPRFAVERGSSETETRKAWTARNARRPCVRSYRVPCGTYCSQRRCASVKTQSKWGQVNIEDGLWNILRNRN